MEHRDTLGRLRAARTALSHGQWLPMPERRTLTEEIQDLAVVTRRYEDVLLAEPEATEVLHTLVSDAVAEARAGEVPDDPERLTGATLMLLIQPGRAPLPEDYPVGLIHLPVLESRMTLDYVRGVVADSQAVPAPSSPSAA